MAKRPVVKAVGVTAPQNSLLQTEARQFAAEIFAGKMKNLEKLLDVFENSAIESRHFAKELEWYTKEHSFPEANAAFLQEAEILAEEACRQALLKSGLREEDIGMIIYVTSTGIATPSLEVKLIQKLGLPLNIRRLPIWGLGCAGGVAGLARARELCKILDGKAVLVVAVELCSLTFQLGDTSKANLIAVSLFADGAAAAVVAWENEGLSLLNSYSSLFPDTEDIMGWDLVDTGFKVRFSRDIPALVRGHLPLLVLEATACWGIDFEKIRHYIVHPGGAKVLEAYADSLSLGCGKLYNACRVLNNYGNMSSVTVLFVLERFLAATPRSEDLGLMLALGPGFSAEQLLFEW